MGYDDVPAGGSDHTQVHRDIATALDAVPSAGGPRLVDLGTVDATDLLAGPVTLYATAAGECVLEFYADATYTDLDSASLLVYVAGVTSVGPTLTLNFGDAPEKSTINPLVAPGGDVLASLYGFGSAPWAAATVYAANAYVIEEGRIWYTDGGTSGGSQPDFASNLGGTVGDNGMTWTDDIAVPTTGSLHVYALVATAEAP